MGSPSQQINSFLEFTSNESSSWGRRKERRKEGKKEEKEGGREEFSFLTLRAIPGAQSSSQNSMMKPERALLWQRELKKRSGEKLDGGWCGH